MKLRKVMGLFAGLVMSAGLLAFTPGLAVAAGSYSLDGGNPVSCPAPYAVWASSTMTPSGVTGYIKVEMVYCPAWQVVWTRAYNYTSRSSVLLATGIDRVSSERNGQYDYVKGTCGSFCLDWVAYGSKSYGAQLWVPSNFSSLGGSLTSTVYYCINSNCSSHQTLTVAAPSVQTRIANVANANLNKTACSPAFVFGGASSCSNPWCAIFAAWVWQNAGANTAGLGTAPSTFEAYGPVNPVPHVGDVVVFYQNGGATHVAIVYSLGPDLSVTSIGGNEDWTHVGLRHFDYKVGTLVPAVTGSTTYYSVKGYVSPKN